jgi:RimJ/RimL family protein N-acetyltransferase
VYLPYGPFENLQAYQQWMNKTCFNGDPRFYAVIDQATGLPTGVASYLSITPEAGSIEVGHINYSPSLQSTAAATEAMYLMMKNAFALGYRRYEWKCNALNRKSCNAALRLGFTYEGIFRQMMVVKGQNRDSAWYSVLDREWPSVHKAFQAWLAPENFDDSGSQRQSLSALTREALSAL